MYIHQLRSVTNQYTNKHKITVISDCLNAEGRHHEKAVKIKGENCQEEEKQPEEGGCMARREEAVTQKELINNAVAVSGLTT